MIPRTGANASTAGLRPTRGAIEKKYAQYSKKVATQLSAFTPANRMCMKWQADQQVDAFMSR